jgi:hypothetical protein
MQFRHALIAVISLALALLAAGCGGGGPSPGVASVATATTGAGTTSTTQNEAPLALPAQGSTANGTRSGFGMTMKMQNGAKFASCMRSHGVPNFPDPNSQGAITFGSSSGINPNSPKFQAAQQVCQKLLPNGGQPSPAEQAKAQQAMLAFSACMRSHGVPTFPDPTFSAGHAQLKIGGSPGSGLDPQSPKFQAAQKACQGNLPGKLSSATAGGK